MEVRPGYKQTEVGVIPEEWQVKRLGELATVTAGGTPSRTNARYWNGDIPWVTTSEVDSCTINQATQCITKEGLKNSAARLLPPGTLLMALYGQGKTRGKVGVLGIEASTNQACAAISLNGNISREFIFHFLASKYETIRNLSNTGNQENLNGSIVRSILVLLPPELEQRAIAETLKDVDALLGALTRLVAKKHDLKQAAMQQLLTGQTRLPGFSGEWEVRRLDEVAIANWGNTAITKSSYRPDGYQAFSASGPDGFVDWFEQESPAVVLSAIGAQCGKTWLAMAKWTAIKNTIWFRAKDGQSDTSFLYRVTGNPSFWPNRGQAQPFIALGDVRAAPICLPPLSEQTAIATVLSDMDAELAALEARLTKTHALKQGMMQELLAGKTRLLTPSRDLGAQP